MFVLLALCSLTLSACMAVAPVGELPASCSGVPGDFRTPTNDHSETSPVSHDASGFLLPRKLIAVAKPATSNTIPSLYVFNDKADYVHHSQLQDMGIVNRVFDKADSEAYWGEIAESQYYQVPWLDKCSIASMLQEPITFHAPKGGLLFMQVIASNCADCDSVSKAIRDTAASRQDLPLSWIQIEVPASVGTLER